MPMNYTHLQLTYFMLVTTPARTVENRYLFIGGVSTQCKLKPDDGQLSKANPL